MLKMSFIHNQPIAYNTKNYIGDAEAAFEQVVRKLSGTDAERNIISEIENGKYVSYDTFTDRFNHQLCTAFLSTGCKAALVVLHNPDKTVSTLECGINAISVILKYCKNGSIEVWEGVLEGGIIYDDSDSNSHNLDIEFNGYKFDNLEELNQYIIESYPNPPGVGKWD